MSEASEEKKGLAERLRAAREQAGLSQGQVAHIFGYHRPTISEIEAGRRKVSSAELTRFANIYDVGVSWLLEESPEVADPAVQLAARDLAKLNKRDLDSVLRLLRTFRNSENKK